MFATVEQYTVRCGHPAPGVPVEVLLARASDDIAAALIAAVYDTALGDVARALADAVCAQVEYWLAIGSDGITTADTWDSVSIGPVSLSGRSGAAPTPVVVSGVELAPRAYRALHLAGLLPGEVCEPW
ncbi:hypothetical protein [Streptomyces sp. Da 82-17]|uniref:hypothetical protein n=1 Tax=Streptomyces sp. Da 82-17 TaxID=3377116 RepID=UPI0038D42C62